MSKDPYRYFRIEAKEIVEQLSRGVLDLEQGAYSKELVGQLLRLAHTLKGAAHVVKQSGIAGLAHQFEDVLMPYQSGEGVPRQHAAALLSLVDGMAGPLAALSSERPQSIEHPAPAPPEETFDTIRVDLSDMDVLLEGVAESSVRLAGLKIKLGTVERAADLSALLLSHLSARAADTGSDRAAVSLAKGRAIASDLQAILSPLSRILVTGVEQVEREVAQLRDTASQLRLVPASAVFAPLRRTARNTAQTLGKQVEFVTSGGEHRLDAHVLAAVRDALMQIVRNAVAHGIEAPQERASGGKPALGEVSLEVRRSGNRVVFCCKDDGRGFDVVALRSAVVARGLVSDAEAGALSAEGVFRLLLRGGGVSTSGAVTEVAGRGIGLDVVRETASKLNAEVALRTALGGGSTVEISVPVSLLSLSAVMAESGGLGVSLPLDAVRQTLWLAESDVAHSPDGDSIVFDGKTVPFMALDRALGQSSSRLRAVRFPAVVVRSGAEHAAVGVDRLLGTATVLLRPIPAFAGVDPMVAGAALDAEGNPQLVLDPAALVLAAGNKRASIAQVTPPRTPLVLVIDDSLTTRMLEQSILETAGYQVHLATSAEEALEKARTENYDLFVVDVEMPGMNGFEFVTLAHATPTLSEVPAILVTSRNSPQDKKRGEEAGARAYVVKSEFDQAQLLLTIRQLIG